MTLDTMLHKAIGAAFAAVTVGAGAMLLSVNRDIAVQDTRLQAVEKSIVKIDDIDHTIRAVDAKVDVLNQKLDDAKEKLEDGLHRKGNK